VKSSRRRFLRLLAAGSAATAATPAAALARAAKPKGAKPPASPRPAPPPPVPAVPPAVAEEIRKQKALVEQAVRAVRDYPLPPGSEPAFVFAPLRPRKRAGTP
jgi:hypothetical protein